MKSTSDWLGRSKPRSPLISGRVMAFRHSAPLTISVDAGENIKEMLYWANYVSDIPSMVQ